MLRTYRSLATVQAAQVLRVDADKRALIVEGDDIPVSAGFLEVHNPRPGGYFLQTAGGQGYYMSEDDFALAFGVNE